MRKLRPLIALALGLSLALPIALAASNSAAAEPTACNADIALRTSEIANLPPSGLRLLAESCPAGRVSQLYYNRAYAAELQQDYQTYLHLIPYRSADSRDDVNFSAYRMFLGLAEAFAPQAAVSPQGRVDWLNQAYEQANELAELRMKGYDRVADRRAREMQANEPEL
ncbi:MAG: hypothetical protein H6926_09185 [Chromatiales bacterium]|nr:hypothetical protein [Chromatiales bacterium]